MRSFAFALCATALCAGCAFVNDYTIFGVEDGGGGGFDAGPRPDSGMTDAGGRDAGPQVLDCSGTFQPAVQILEDVGYFQSPAVTRDELEMFYGASTMQGGPQELRYTRRSSNIVPFPAGQRVEEVEGYCLTLGTTFTGRTVDVSADGLELYVSCSDTTVPTDVPLLFFRRPTRTMPFVFVSQIGTAFCCASVSPSGLELYSSTQDGFLRVATRANTTEVFASNLPVPGLENAPGRSPDLAPDGRSLFATIAPGMFVVEYPRAADGVTFSPTAIQHTVLPSANALGGVDITADCRRVYFAAAVTDAAGLSTQHIYVSSR